MKVSIGKNTLGGGKKMMTRLNNYNRSTHDLSRVIRTTAAPGTLIPTFKEKVLPGDTFNIRTRCHILTHPTVGPLFGSFKVQNDFFFCPDRLYIAALHNNALNVGLNMKSIKYPIIGGIRRNLWDDSKTMEGSNGTLKREVNPSSLPAYLGYRSLSDEKETPVLAVKATPFFGYFDIFKNYYANKQEEYFYTIGSVILFTVDLALTEYNTFRLSSFANINGTWTKGSDINNVTNGSTSLGAGVYAGFSINENIPGGIEEIIINGKISFSLNNVIHEFTGQSIKYLIDNKILKEIDYIKASIPNLKTFIFYENKTTETSTFKMEKLIKIASRTAVYNKYRLEDIDNLRESILTSGKAQYDGARFTFLSDIFKPIIDLNTSNNKTRPSCSYPMVGLALKTYQSDINTNWVNTEWIEGESGINAITAIDTSGGSFTLDTLNLAKKVYTMLNRIAVSDGSYNAWIQTVYTSGGLNHVETPIYLGGSSMEIEFQEVINNSGTEDQPLGSLAGRGITNNHKGGTIKYKPDEPGYIFCITSITPRVDYFQGNDWDLEIETLDDLHKPQLDGIGFQDRLYKNINSNAKKEDLIKSIGKQPAWLDYMTSFNRNYGNFALIENEGWMCLNRVFGDIDTYTTYVQPHLYNNIFADTDVTAQNFWVQIAFDVEARRVMSAKIIPNL